MAHYEYVGRDRSGKKRTGKIIAHSRSEVIAALRDKGIAVLDIREVKPGLLQSEITLGTPVKLRDLVVFLRQFATLLRSGVTVVDSTNILSRQTESKALHKVLLSVEEDLRAGNPLSASVAKHPKIFPPILVSMVQAGEAAGNLDEVLERLALYFEKQHETRQKVLSALAYPVAVGLIAVVVVAFLLVQVVPAFTDLFASVGSELPLITRFVLEASGWMQSYWWLLLLAAVLIYAAKVLARRHAQGRYYLDHMKLKLPVFGRLLQKALLARMSRTLSSLFSSSVPILQSLSIVERVAENEVIARAMREAREALEKGFPLHETLARHWVFPPMVVHMVAIGEQTGTLDHMLAKVADFYEMEVDQATSQLKSLIEPLLIVLLGVLVGTIVIAIIVPMFTIFNEIGNL
ncbi:Type II secretion system F domain containing protein [Caldalkalibacillus thermarum TA2.A1]|uniref:Type II secretion system F domain containing protein n=1 Tax=Caldalkalibacillus thermarum (strain TA2.A1) TaxID=986075 RepID=F5LAL9_CALTT|nr:type II secretion system F family protein [Caldalkalibacillus thermarum]EGL81591.1 Type II secretion system F domain containing protein [Caldalkalibacillus thermarum TA2.A1]QZT33519.1 type II secretion system F family protein [Caldalkalibacillus thermarum TA2.A1]